jgi:hypothetical protein
MNPDKITLALQKRGGEYIGSMRRWIQWECFNGDSVQWGSQDYLEFRRKPTEYDFERLADRIATAALTERFTSDEDRAIRHSIKSLLLIRGEDELQQRALSNTVAMLQKLLDGYSELTAEEAGTIVKTQWEFEIKADGSAGCKADF